MIDKAKKVTSKYLSHYLDVPKGFGKIAWLVLVESLAMSVSFFISIYFSKALGFNQAQIGYCISIMLSGSFCGALTCGYLTSKIRPVLLTSAGFILFGAAFSFLSITQSFYNMLPVMFACGFSSVLMMTSNLTSLVKLSDDDHFKNKALVLQSVIFNFTVTITAYIISSFSYQSLKSLFILISASLFVAGIMTIKMSLGATESVNNCNKEKDFRPNYSLLTCIIPMIICYSVVFAMVKSLFAIDAINRFDNNGLSWVIMSLNPLLVVFMQPTLFSFLKNKNNILLMTVGGVCLCLGYLFFGITKLFIPSLFFIVLATIGEMIVSPISKRLASSSLGQGYEGMGLSMWKVVYYISGMIGASSTGYIGHRLGHEFAWLVCLPLSLIIIFSYWRFNKVSTNTVLSHT
tara:strand:- start:364 stop:1575 length:1212 start_codon:yes stop_codon:yes gene_type:complete